MRKIKFMIPGEPRGKQRHRYRAIWAKHVIQEYTPSETVAYEKLVAASYWKAKDAEVHHGAVGIHIDAYFGIPKSATKKEREEMLDGTRPCTKKPDIDNIEKIVEDGLKKAGYDDDRQVVFSCVHKEWAEIPRVEVELWEV